LSRRALQLYHAPVGAVYGNRHTFDCYS